MGSALFKCKACGHDVAKSAKACPKCGAPVRRTSIGTILGAAVLGVIIVSCFGALSKSRESREAAAEAVATEPPIEVSAAALVRAYDGNEIAADGQYKGRIVRVTGVVDNVGKDLMDTMYIAFRSGDVRAVQCYFDNGKAAELARVQKGDKLTVRGRVDGLMMNVMVKDCILE